MGYRKIADYLNERGYRTREGKVFVVSTIQRILSNPIYIGRKRYKTALGGTQPYNEKLRIISDELFKQAEQIRKSRQKQIKEQDKSGIPRTGKLLFSGLAYCKFCGAKLTSNYLYRTSQNKKSIIYRYKCPLNKGKLYCNHKQNIWGGKKYDTLILKKIKAILSQIEVSSFLAENNNMKNELLKIKERNIHNVKKEYLDLVKQQEKLNLEIGKALVGDSNFTPEQLSQALKTIEKQIKIKQSQIETLKEEFEKEKEKVAGGEVANVENWVNKLDEADEDLKKAMLSKLINKVFLGKNEIEIELNVSFIDIVEEKVLSV